MTDQFDDDGAPPPPGDDPKLDQFTAIMEETDAPVVPREISPALIATIHADLSHYIDHEITPMDPYNYEVLAAVGGVFLATALKWLGLTEVEDFPRNRDGVLALVGRMSAALNAVQPSDLAFRDSVSPSERVH